MQKEEVTAKVIQCVAESLAIPSEGVRADSSLIDDLGADSLDFLDIMFALERVFKVSFGKEQFDLLQKVGLSKEEAIQEGNLTPAALVRLAPLLPRLPKSGVIPVRNLRGFITVETIVQIVIGLIKPNGSTA